MKKKIFIIIGLCITLSGISLAAPKYISEKDISSVMAKFTQELMVECSFCHIRDKSATIKNRDKYDIEGDFAAMRHQRVARAMIGAEKMFNERKKMEISCVDCHKGKPEPPKM